MQANLWLNCVLHEWWEDVLKRGENDAKGHISRRNIEMRNEIEYLIGRKCITFHYNLISVLRRFVKMYLKDIINFYEKYLLKSSRVKIYLVRRRGWGHKNTIKTCRSTVREFIGATSMGWAPTMFARGPMTGSSTVSHGVSFLKCPAFYHCKYMAKWSKWCGG